MQIGHSLVNRIIDLYSDATGISFNHLVITTDESTVNTKLNDAQQIQRESSKNQNKNSNNEMFNSHIPPQFRYEEYQELDKQLTQRYGLPFTYKRLDEKDYFYIPYGYNYTYLAQPHDFCSSDTFMVVMIMSTVKKPEERRVLRETWFKDKTILGKKIKYLFIVSSSPDQSVNRAIDEEAEQFNEI